jgi:NAD(P)-dependent dehydrogenase (short-subunit alcohol dehydrogenase family)
MTQQLQGKRALVTGGSRGIGAAIVKRLAGEGAHVALTYVSKPDQANETAKAARALGVQAIVIQADNAGPKAVAGAVERTVRELGGTDILVNNANVDGSWTGPSVPTFEGATTSTSVSVLSGTCSRFVCCAWKSASARPCAQHGWTFLLVGWSRSISCTSVSVPHL